MSKSTNMLRTRRRDNSVKPNRRLDRKSSRGMIYENEELRLRTININAEIERGQYDIKKLKRENEMLKKEIWSLRDEYDKLDKLLKEKEYDFSSSSTTCTSDSESGSTVTDEESEEVETSQNLQNVQKTNMKNLHAEFDHLSVVPEENSTENSEPNSNPSLNEEHCIKPDQSYPIKNFFSPINTLPKTSADLIVQNTSSASTFSNGGNLEELLNDIETISQDILKITNDQVTENNQTEELQQTKPFKSELNVVLMPNPMPLLGFDKYRNIQSSFDSLHSKSLEKITSNNHPTEDKEVEPQSNPFFFGNLTSVAESSNNSEYFQTNYNPENYSEDPKQQNGSKTNLIELTSSELISSENEENLKFQTTQKECDKTNEDPCKPKLSIRRKVSIHFKGKKDKSKSKFFDIKFGGGTPASTPQIVEAKHQKTPSLESKKSTTDAEPSSDSKTGSEKKVQGSVKHRKSSSASPERKHVHVKDDKKHKNKHRKSLMTIGASKTRRGTVSSVDRFNRERSFSVCTDRSNNVLDNRLFYEDFSERERTNSLSSCDTIKTRKMSNISNIPLNGKVPWCACWGNGCL